MPEEEAFAVLHSMMRRYRLRELFKPGMQALTMCLYQLDRLLAEHRPQLHDHFARENVQTSSFASQWYLALFATVLPLPLVFRVVDAFVAAGIETLHAVALAILSDCEYELLRMSFEEIMQCFQSQLMERYADEARAAALLAQALAPGRVSRRRLERLERDYSQQNEKERQRQEEMARLRRDASAALGRVYELQREGRTTAEQLRAAQQREASLEGETQRLKTLLAAERLRADSAESELAAVVQQLVVAKLRVAELEAERLGSGARAPRPAAE